ncbi:class I SAM-dependent methyltransferase [Paenibacillus oenotherae]|uniref:Class I SAM-dependent methyltransferase n=2 Tax=Paenibacillus oenotherae TaxID=1435645 RepID=A0ABS7DBB5_9BACL|nr:class I SAM-dependent methyltransferase [Paenibacillus oenotherae]MBW7477230.1 class I SAM-dependent methyltransferase [Paenibacillus oenotherae]
MISLYNAISLLFVVVVLLAVLSIVYASWRNGISPMPSSAIVRYAVSNEINRLEKGGIIVEAGSGWGTLALHVLRHCSCQKLIGIENSPVPLWVSRLSVRLLLSRKSALRGIITFNRGDIYTYSYERADVVLCYLYPGAMERLNLAFNERLKPGARVISVCFALPGWRPERIITCNDLYRTKIYVYRTVGYSGNIHS